MQNLFQETSQTINKDQPLAARMRPGNFDDFVGQEHILAPGKLLRRAIESDRLTSLIFYGPPGCGKNCLAHIISKKTGAKFVNLNAAISNVAQLKDAIYQARHDKQQGKKTILFLDEIHRFNKAQQDVLMPDVEEGSLILIGATTHNPFFSIVSALLSRSQIFELKPLSGDNLIKILKRAISSEKGFKHLKINADEKAFAHIAKISEGDARRALNALEIGILTTLPDKQGIIHFDLGAAEESIQKKAVVYDSDEDEHYDTISAFIKSMRGSDPDAALYWLAKMLYAGEDIRFIARRIVICASEDVGNADPHALLVATSALQAVEFVGMPEARIPLAQAAVYVACAPKSNASYMGIEKAAKDVESGKVMPVPDYLKSANYSGAKKLGRGQGYKYSHNYKDHYIDQNYTPEKHTYYEPTEHGYEKIIKERLEKLKNQKNSKK